MTDVSRRDEVKGVIFALLRERAGAQVHAAIDINTDTRARFLAAARVPVLTLEGAQELIPGFFEFCVESQLLSEIRPVTDHHFHLMPRL